MQFPSLSSTLSSPHPASILGVKISPTDRTPYPALVSLFSTYVTCLLSSPSTTELYIVGESFGATLLLSILPLIPSSLAVKLKLSTLINPATSYLTSNLRSTLNLLLSFPPPLYPILLPLTLPLFLDPYQPLSLLLITTSYALPSTLCSEEREAYMGRVALTLNKQLEYMDRETMEFRSAQWLEVAPTEVKDAIKGVKGFDVLLVPGTFDLCLPSVSECRRLSQVLTDLGNRVTTHEVRGAGHGGTVGGRVDLGRVIKVAVEGGGMVCMEGERIQSQEGVMLGMKRREEVRRERGAKATMCSRQHFDEGNRKSLDFCTRRETSSPIAAITLTILFFTILFAIRFAHRSWGRG